MNAVLRATPRSRLIVSTTEATDNRTRNAMCLTTVRADLAMVFISLENDEHVHHYQRERVSITGVGL